MSITITKHGLQQMASRSITREEVVAAVSNGHVMINRNDSNKRTIIDNKQRLYVVTNDRCDIVITTFRSN